MSTILHDQSVAIENVINQSLAAAGSALTHPVMLTVFALAFGPPLAFAIYKLYRFVEKDDVGLVVAKDWNSHPRKK